MVSLVAAAPVAMAGRLLARLVAGIAALAAVSVWAHAPSDLRSGFVLVANQQSASASLINLEDDTATVIPVGAGPHEAVISPSGRTGIVTIYGPGGAPGNEVAVIDISKGVVTKTISLGQYTRPHGANFLPGDETRVAVTSETTQNVVIVNLASGSVEHAIPTAAATSHMVAITADGRRAFTSNIGGGSVSELDLTSRSTVRTIAVAPRVEGIAVTPDGSAVWAGSNTNGTVSIIDTKTGAIAVTLTGLSLPYRLAMSKDGRTAIVCDPQVDKLHVADVQQRKIVWTLDGLGSPRGVNIAPDGRTAFVTLAADETMGVIDLETRTLARKIKVQQSPDGVWYGPAPLRSLEEHVRADVWPRIARLDDAR
jgi:YVTN family beta-propeller protein